MKTPGNTSSTALVLLTPNSYNGSLSFTIVEPFSDVLHMPLHVCATMCVPHVCAIFTVCMLLILAGLFSDTDQLHYTTVDSLLTNGNEPTDTAYIWTQKTVIETHGQRLAITLN